MNDLIAIDGIKLDESTFTMRLLASNQRRAAATKTVQDNVAAARTVADGVGDKGNRLDGRMHGEFVQTFSPKGVYAGIGPNIATVATMPPKFNVVDMFAAPFFQTKISSCWLR